MKSYAARDDNTVHDTIDGEVLAIRSDTGAYYSMTGAAATCWVAVVGGHSLDDIAHAVATHHGTTAAEVTDAIAAFADSLVDEALLMRSTAATAGAPADLPAETAGTAWQSPTFDKYTDMQDLLLFDPIHEVKPAGWPHAADTAT